MQQNSKYNFVLPDQFLENQICTQCKKYLSCGPVKTYAHDGIYEVRCGRCVRDKDGGFVSTFNKLFEDALFPCVNRLEGCNSLVPYKGMKAHEEVCKGTDSACPACPPEEPATYSLMALISHFKSKHWKNFLEKPVFDITRNVETYYLYHDFTKHFLVLVRIKFNAEALLIKVASSLKTVLRHIIYNSSDRSDSTEIYKSDLITCRSLGDTSKELRIPMMLIGSCEQLQGKIEVDLVGHMVQRIETPELGLLDSGVVDESNLMETAGFVEKQGSLPRRTLPKLRTDTSYFNQFSNSYMFRDDWTSVINVKSLEKFGLVCNFCENFLSTNGTTYFHCFRCPFTFCCRCYINSISRSYCPICLTNSVKGPFPNDEYCNLEFNCEFGCGHRSVYWKLLLHKDDCKLNKNRDLTDKEKINRYFGVTANENDTFHRHNSIAVDKSKSWRKGKIYVVTRDDVMFIVDHDIDERTKIIKFKVSHGYDNVAAFIKLINHRKEYFENMSIRTSDHAFFVVKFKEMQNPVVESGKTSKYI